MEIDSLRRGLDEVLSAQRAREELSGHRAEAMAEELAGARQALHRLEAESEGCRGQLQSLGGAVQELSRARQDQAAQQEAVSRELADARASMQRLQAQSEDFQSRLQSQMQEMERLRAEKSECARAHEACARDRALLFQRLQEVESGLSEARSQPGAPDRFGGVWETSVCRFSSSRSSSYAIITDRVFAPVPCYNNSGAISDARHICGTALKASH